ncbi:hypothetical protein HMPREF9080_02629 [Cardiobacterium valvarum F0432]|uniref:Uncharacterized protein n=1 Tax=Cardiobacterium valvarum F0432 TaxID=797473 RepID=G9ZIL8_9GAMM|nr:hypothetical protein HMPREF9080_02629 [Cardiobacterium valvarum F0432]
MCATQANAANAVRRDTATDKVITHDFSARRESSGVMDKKDVKNRCSP